MPRLSDAEGAPARVGGGRAGAGADRSAPGQPIAYLRTTLRVPLGPLQQALATLWEVRLSQGALVDVLRRVAQASAPERAQLEEAIRASPAVHADEMGWREDGVNGYIWVRATPQGAQLFHYACSRAGAVAQGLLDDCTGVRCTDFYAGYNGVSGRKQRCWAHLLRDSHALGEAHPERADVQAWRGALSALFTHGQAVATGVYSAAQREAAYAPRETRLVALGQCYARTPAHPCRTLAQRLLRHRGEFFEFVRHPEVGATNNEAERSLRPLVIGRKISGGTRSAQGSQTRLDLALVFGSWHAQGANPFQRCLAMLQTPTPLL